ncbi:MAG: DUF4910 domain-containing protein [Armatimonadota bacterium]
MLTCEAKKGEEVSPQAIGAQLYALAARLYPICRSITGEGTRETLRVLQEHVPLTMHEVPSGTPVFDWTVPPEWNVRDACVLNSRGRRVIDFRRSNLHLLGYSVPVHRTVSREELLQHLYTLPEHPDRIPYRTSYYSENWGFCVPHSLLTELTEPEYRVRIDTRLAPGHLTYGELLIPGATDEEVLLSCHVCHPSLANDNLSGIAIAAKLAEHLRRRELRYSYRFLFIPGTIGSITWLARNRERVDRIRHGLVLACLGDGGRSTYKKSRRGDAEIDRAVAHVLRHRGDHELLEFTPYGYDERQFCSPGFDLPVGLLMRTPHGRFPEYHTSADNLELIRPWALADSFAKCLDVIAVLEGNRRYVNLNPCCEPQLGRRGLYRKIGAPGAGAIDEMALLWVLSLSDRRHSLLEIAERAGLPFSQIRGAADALLDCELLSEARED